MVILKHSEGTDFSYLYCPLYNIRKCCKCHGCCYHHNAICFFKINHPLLLKLVIEP